MMLPKPIKYAAISGGTAVFGLMFGWLMFPALLKHQLKKEMALSKKTDVRQMWEVIPFPLDFKIYFFNYTNVEDIMNGAQPIVKEVGPYHFEEWKVKEEIMDRDEDDTVSYKKRDTFIFKKELSGPGLTGEEELVIPHPLILSAVVTIARSNMAMVGMAAKGALGVFDNPSDVFMRVKPLDALFRGVIINCARTEFAPKAVCSAFKKEDMSVFTLEPNNQIRFSFFGKYNGSVDPRVFTVKRGIKNVMEVGTVVAIDGNPQLTVWRDTCNNYSGTDRTVFPPFLTDKDRLQSYTEDLCRTFKPWFQKKTSYKGIKTNRYTVNIGDLANDPELNCYCDAPDKCPLKGLMDLSKCIKAPMYLSLPHFHDCDPSLHNAVKGLNPNAEEHAMIIDFEPISGTTMFVKQRLQFNIELLKTEKHDLFKKLPGTIAPIFWLEEGLALNKTFVKMLKVQLFIPKKAVGVIRWLLLSFGSIGAIAGVVFHYKTASGEKNKVTTVKPEEEEKGVSVIGQQQGPTKVDM
uniref:Sensory neuron membrane protein 1 n=1 Tax=Ectropis obliqua TaxID=248899 RepID=A0A0H4CUW6_ECTOB|nr:sensory neuron membrane protein 1 [Ectropis obliqua]AZB86632.1 sensory neuron membrane protein 1 [Ectropis obliqua]